ncbi:phosphate transport system permease protein PstA [Desulfuromonas versatilis]|uniref:Phosphate transport system permease protein PstA n=1 Tax=Desulfuromonas versatilis TaxID=2802975 RepID=A0ABN6E3J5_9BACT|nr:phosphate ABC transporter permease PstA [Desulfuromonas versatilis]BCR06787.1 phosphate transport system permease protein PstA [Desulfuromonas versatilis]
MKKFFREGEPFVWATGAALALTLLIALALVVVVMVNGLGVFWPSNVALLELRDGGRVAGEILQREPLPSGEGERLQLKTGNRDLYGLDFRWLDEAKIAQQSYPEELIALEREEYGNFYGLLQRVEVPEAAAGGAPLAQLNRALEVVAQKHALVADYNHRVAGLSREMERLRLELLKLEYRGVAAESPEVTRVKRQRTIVRQDFDQLVALQGEAVKDMERYKALFTDVAGTEKLIPLSHIVRLYQPNQMGWGEKSLFYLSKLKELILGEPREANTEGGLYPAIFGTVMLIFLMSLVSFPLGVIAAVYLREYAKDGPVVRIVRIAVNNLAGIPSIVYGIFGLGFFVYGIGATIDQLFFPERLPSPTFGTGGILWASLTLALLTVPVVIVATEEALGAIPAGVREGSLALGATKFQTLCRTLLPMASPGIMTGLILAMARAAGEVAPLMITGVVKLAPALPLDGTFPFLHLDRKFMHLGFHIYDIGFQSPNVEAAKPMVFVTTLLLVLIVLVMSSVAITLRNRMKKRFTYGTF